MKYAYLIVYGVGTILVLFIGFYTASQIIP